MKCSKCGAECNENLAFCLECGNPLQLMADFNLIEKELANSIGAFMDEMDNEPKEEYEIEDDMKTIDVPLDEIDMELKIVDINRGTSKFEIEHKDTISFEEDVEEDESPVYTPRPKRKRRKKKNKKKKFIIAGIVVSIIAIAVVVAILVFGKDKNKDENVTKDFAYYYELASDNMKDKKFGDAYKNGSSALENAKNNEEIVKARLLIKSAYEAQKLNTGDFYMENLQILFELGENSEDNAKKLLDYYADKRNAIRLLNMFDLVSEEFARECLGDNFIEKPEVSVPTGEYNNAINVEIEAAKGSTIYYAVYKTGESFNYVEYIKEIEIVGAGDYILSTYSVDAEGMVSYKAVCNYKIVEGEATGPVITPASGTYKEPTKITIEVPKGGKVYYTYDGTTPTKKSEVYKEPIDMLRGVNTFKAIYVDKYGNESAVTTLQYNLKLTRKETIATAKDKLWNHYLSNGLIDADGNMADGSVISITYHNAAEIDNGEYYVFLITSTATDGTTVMGVTYCGVNTFDGTVFVGLVEAGGEFTIPGE